MSKIEKLLWNWLKKTNEKIAQIKLEKKSNKNNEPRKWSSSQSWLMPALAFLLKTGKRKPAKIAIRKKWSYFWFRQMPALSFLLKTGKENKRNLRTEKMVLFPILADASLFRNPRPITREIKGHGPRNRFWRMPTLSDKFKFAHPG